MSFIERKKISAQKLFPGLVGRRAEIMAVKYALRQMEARASASLKVKDYPNLFYFYGSTGAGKTFLLKQIQQDCNHGELGFYPLCAWLSCHRIAESEAIAQESFLIELSRALLEADESLHDVLEPVFQCWQRYADAAPLTAAPAATVTPTPAAPQPTTTVLRTAAPNRPNPVRAAYGTLANLEIKKRADGSQDVKALAKNIDRKIQSFQPPSQSAAPPPADHREDLQKLFAKAVDAISGSQRVVFFIDDYQVFERYDLWFRQQLLPLFQREVLFVIAGENDLHKAYVADLGNVAACIRLSPFSVFDAETYFQQQNRAIDTKLMVGAHRLAEGTPVSLALIAGAFNAMAGKPPSAIMNFLALPDEDYGDKIHKYIAYIMMDQLSPVDQNLLGILAIMRTFDVHLFQHLAGILNVKQTLDGLAKRYPFVSTFGDMPDFVKKTLRGYLKQEQPNLYEEINQSAYHYFADRVREDPEEHALLYDALYYYLHVNPREAYKHFTHLISHFMHTHLDLCDRLCLIALEASLPKEVRERVRSMARSLGSFRKKDPTGSQFVLAEATNAEPFKKDELQLLSQLFLLGG